MGDYIDARRANIVASRAGAVLFQIHEYFSARVPFFRIPDRRRVDLSISCHALQL